MFTLIQSLLFAMEEESSSSLSDSVDSPPTTKEEENVEPETPLSTRGDVGYRQGHIREIELPEHFEVFASNAEGGKEKRYTRSMRRQEKV